MLGHDEEKYVTDICVETTKDDNILLLEGILVRDFSGTAIDLGSNDIAITDDVLFSAAIVVLLRGCCECGYMGKAPDIADASCASPEVFCPSSILFSVFFMIARHYPGSTAVRKKLMAGAAGTVKRVSLELDGNAPCIVFDGANLDVAIKGSVKLEWFPVHTNTNCGQSIGAEALIQDFEDVSLTNLQMLFPEAVQSMQVGDGFSEGGIRLAAPIKFNPARMPAARFIQASNAAHNLKVAQLEIVQSRLLDRE
ncbi:hypothetical protein DKX38_012581 [Salix brachista]|uniref:Aldehyde dehydrogenase domain-containing protein n=1 Tax=Salix brachista TaxID=2182728 RepID=A0A5N5LP09_9ROSI|nr:hypothetical protein DKX38_012581 [Salix brachista]